MFLKKLKYKIEISGMSCMHCAKRIEEELKKIKDLEKVTVNFEDKCAYITSKKDIDKKLIKDTIEALDYIVLDIIAL